MKIVLNIKSSYSFLQSVIRIEEYVSFAVSKKLTHLAIADYNLHAIFDFYNLCIKNNLQPVIGLRLNIDNDDLLIFAKNYKGLQTLFKLSKLQSEKSIRLIELEDDKNCFYLANKELFSEIPVTNKQILNENKIVTHLRSEEIDAVNYLLKIGDFGSPLMISFEKALSEAVDYEFIKDINLILPSQQVNIPAINDHDENYNINYLKQLSLKGLTKRVKISDTYLHRLNSELNTIISMGYTNYFLIVYDYVLYAKKNHILVGPGRGSAAGSLVAYALGITDIDPLQYDLIFERFLNPERISMPDIDLDFPYDKRSQVIDYITDKYGEDHVANIITYGTFQAKQVVRDLARVMNISSIDLNEITKLMDSSKSLTKNLDNLKLKIKLNSSNDLKKLLKIALKLEGLPRHTSIHAAGVVISKEPLINKIPIVKNNDGSYLTGISMEHLEPLGLLKMDILAIKNLSLIDNVLTKVKLDFNVIPLDDSKTLELFSAGLTEGIFQFEATGMKKFLRAFKPDHFEDLVAATALYRPGPMGSIYDFAKRKNKEEEIVYPHPDLEEILKPTYGLIVYQEQIMQIAVKIANFSMGKADILRKAMGKKDRDSLSKLKQEFIEGGTSNKYQLDFLEALFDLVLKFADYGFPKAHAVSYATISYKMAYLKTHYTEDFMANLLNINLGSEIKISEYIGECNKLNLTVVKPNINTSTEKFIITDSGLLYPLLGLKGVGSASVNVILTERAKAPFDSFIDFVMRCYGQAVKENTLVSLIKAGVFSIFQEKEATLIKNLDAIINYASLVKDIDKGLVPEPELIDAEDFSDQEQLENEIAVFGFYLSKHPTIKYKNSNIVSLIDIDNHAGETIKIIGAVNKVKVIKTKTGEPMAFIELCDETGKVNATFFPQIFKMLPIDLKNVVLEIVGNVNHRNNEYQILANRVEIKNN